METLRDWIEEELYKHGWRQADLAHRAGIAEPTLSRILSGSRNAGPEVCLALAKALDVPPERVFRVAGLLPPIPPAAEQEHQLRILFRRLDAGMRRVALDILRALSARSADDRGRPGTLADRLARDVASSLEAMPPEDQRRVLALLHTLEDEQEKPADRPARGDQRGAQERGHVPVEPDSA